ncbi:8471_t:CDS:10 [Paraglomus brasilianum]|uniref:8471_t:CDS:1 n=1 Tax=Paraglomus brasilianum TaxID=144538 RepID=A0A9N9C694_9GLOM|nr:8471_t:CDS:10 [Paraglomus brasilianum]
MGKRDKKTGKGRLDKYYHLAKDQGYRARSAFKLIQINKKYNFLEKSRVLIDLCAAPGGWLQVAKKYMPSQSLIIGVDLVPIKPIPGIITLQDDITSDKCRANLRAELKHWKADVILHDGAPNVGVAWIQDAYSQCELTLMALKLSVGFLTQGGIFVTKVFRSADYNNLLWVFNQLFKSVEATKPASSRIVSAEIFVICRDFIAPKKIDPKLLDPRAVFKELNAGPSRILDILHPEKKRRHREGYEDGNYTLFKSVSAIEFIDSEDPIKLLGDVNQITFDNEEAMELRQHKYTNEDIRTSCEDIKVLGKREFKDLLKWRKKIREWEAEPEDEDKAIQEELDRLVQESKTKTKKLRRKANEKRQKSVVRMQLNMITPADIGIESNKTGELMFDPKEVDGTEASIIGMIAVALDKLRKGKGELAELDALDALDESDSDNLDELEADMDNLYEEYKERRAERDAKYAALKRKAEKMEGLSEDVAVDDMEVDSISKGNDTDLSDKEEKIVEQDQEQSESGDAKSNTLKRKAEEMDESSDDTEDDDIEIVPKADESEEEMWDANASDEDEEKMKKAQTYGLTTAEAITLAQQLVNRQKTTGSLIDDGFNRHAFNDRIGLPSWFLDDETKHNKPNLPVTKEAIRVLRERMKALNARPIKKIAEAKARKKMRAVKKLTKLQKKTEAVAEGKDMTEREKADVIAKMVNKAATTKKRQVKVVVARGTNKGNKGRPKGVKGRYKMVDARMKKEVRALKRADKHGKNSKKQKR